MNLLRALGPNGILAWFFKKHKHSIGKEVSSYALDLLDQKSSLDCVNGTFITLIPKIKLAQKDGDFKPISLCDVVYKIIFKVLTSRLKGILPQIISPTQSDFILGHFITNNILIAYEALHFLTNKCHGSNKLWLLSWI